MSLPGRVMLQAFQKIFFHLSERNVCRVVLLSDKNLQMLANSVVTIQSRCLYFLLYLFEFGRIAPSKRSQLCRTLYVNASAL